MKYVTEVKVNDKNSVYKVSEEGCGFFIVVAKSIDDVIAYIREEKGANPSKCSIEFIGSAITVDSVDNKLIAEGDFADGKNPSINANSGNGDIRFLQIIENIPVDENNDD